MEGKPTEPEPELVFADEVILGFQNLRSNELKTISAREENQSIYIKIRDKIAEQGIPDEVRLEAGVIMAAARHPMIERGMHSSRLLTRLREIDASLQDHPGETVAWLDEKEEIVAHRDPGPNRTRTEYLLNLGILPRDAKVRVNTIGEFFIPVPQYVSINLAPALPGQEIDFDKENIVTGPGPVEKQVFTEPDEIFLSVPRMLSTKKTILVGNEEVRAMFEDNSLEDDPYVYIAAEVLLESFRAANNLEPEPPPA